MLLPTTPNRPVGAPHPVVVIGAGLAGLTAAARLARNGIPVVVLESSAEPGGRARTTERDGFHHNLGPHAIARRGPGTAVLKELGIALPGRSPSIAGARFLRDGRVVTALGRRRGGAGVRLGPALARFGRTAAAAPPGTSVRDVIAQTTDDPATRELLRAMARLSTYTDALEEQSAGVVAEVAAGGWVRYLDGGWGALVARLREAVETAGGQVRPASPVIATETGPDGAAPTVHLHDGGVRRASAVIVAVGGPAQVTRLVNGPARRHLEAWADVAEPVRLACLDVALSRRPRMPSIVLGTDRPLYLSVQSDRSRIAPSGGAVVQLARYLDRR